MNVRRREHETSLPQALQELEPIAAQPCGVCCRAIVDSISIEKGYELKTMCLRAHPGDELTLRFVERRQPAALTPEGRHVVVELAIEEGDDVDLAEGNQPETFRADIPPAAKLSGHTGDKESRDSAHREEPE